CSGVERNHEEQAGRLYTSDEMAAIGDALNLYPGRVSADCLRLVMLTGCRPCEAKQARWSEFAKVGHWSQPSSHPKQKKVHGAPRSKHARQLVERLRSERANDSPDAFVFPGKSAGTHIDMGLNHAWYFVRREAGLSDECRIYDLRHSFASIASSNGAS